ncbi:hypothetical protein [Schaalia sp. ZJ1691]|uniref:hypothetical protein n=1 Tax=Schaalia sp. ZJ1691 TaxID=2709404 RepID=UPI0013EC99E0|nr:hypothetical protein [Schaalia sp. ZJ1691]
MLTASFIIAIITFITGWLTIGAAKASGETHDNKIKPLITLMGLALVLATGILITIQPIMLGIQLLA